MSKKKEKYHHSNYSFLAVFFIMIFVAGVTILALSLFVPTKLKEDDNVSKETNTSKQEKESNGGSNDVGRGGDDDENPDKTPVQNEDIQEKKGNGIDFSVTKSEVVNNKYIVRVTIYEDVSESGTCTLEMKSKNDDYIKRTAKVIEAGAGTYSCEGFDIQTEGIASGKYTYTITIESGSKKGGFSGEINI